MVAATFLAFGCIQVASSALLLHRGPYGFGLAVYHALDRIAPADFVEDMLAHDALAHGDTDLAQHYAVRMSPGERRDDLLADVALARGQDVLAYEYFYVADDAAAVRRFVVAKTVHDIPGAIETEAQFRAKLIAEATHPDAVAESYEFSGNLEASLNHEREAMNDYEAAIALAPLNQSYLLSAANQSLSDHKYADARAYYQRTLRIDPASADALAGLGVLAVRAGRREEAQRYYSQSRRIDPNAGMVIELARELK